MEFAEYLRANHPVPGRMRRVPPPKLFEVKYVKVKTSTVTKVKASVLIGILASAVVPPQYATLVSAIASAYWLVVL